MTIIDLSNRFFSERSFALPLKLTVFLSSLVLYSILLKTFHSGVLESQDWRLLLYVLYLLIFTNTFLCGFFPGMIVAVLSSMLAAVTLVPKGIVYNQISVADLEIFPFIAMYFLVAITVDWFRENIERLREQLAENEQLHQQARRMEKLTLAGEIAAGIAHEVRNPLTVVQGYIQLISSKCNKQCDTEETFTILQEELKRANNIISDFLRFSRPDQPHIDRVNINSIIESTTSLIYGEAIRNNVRISLSPDKGIPTVSVDKGQMIQVFLNLFRNAIQAMPQGGEISVCTGYDEQNQALTIKVLDRGTGMTAETMEKLFSPFFTTKDDGTGLGLAITETIIHFHGGQIAVESALGEGTAFIITLPTRYLPQQPLDD